MCFLLVFYITITWQLLVGCFMLYTVGCFKNTIVSKAKDVPFLIWAAVDNTQHLTVTQWPEKYRKETVSLINISRICHHIFLIIISNNQASESPYVFGSHKINIPHSVKGWGKSNVLACFGHISIKIMLKINREQSKQRKYWEIIAF